MPETIRYFRLADHIGVEPSYTTDPETGEPVENPKKGELQPLVVQKLTLGVPVMRGDEVITDVQAVEIQPYDAEKRILAVKDPLVANAVAGLGTYEEIDPPKGGRRQASRLAADTGEQGTTVSETPDAGEKE